ncbi:predicted protein [Histoplasma mississippiense (nom. inval.)]|uniref:predicted protein n=1 Tax=Ajellomyces capsulatus (strain NAm1 / WU24) TaxID=2059318 RepID=UPI000157B8B2|nr:predicted protein [Histoplasma mississippiense (nom. inval.)]EDN03534.1 predicted protein [Histoplasma mississippiense (nom. inval.)]
MGETGAATYGSSAGSGVEKGKGKAMDNHVADDSEDVESSSDESTADLQCVLVHTRVFSPSPRFSLPPLLSAWANCSFFSPTTPICCGRGGTKNVEDEEDVGQDNLEPISAENIIGDGRRTRGKTIDFAAAAKKAEEDGEPIGEDDDDDDGDFEAHDDSNIPDDVDMTKD